MSALRAFVRLIAVLALTAVLIPCQAVAVLFGPRRASALPLFYHRLVCRILGFAIVVRGRPSHKRPTLFAVNHASYLDITVLGGLIAGNFVAKAEVANWPLFGLLAKLQRSVFVVRRVRSTQMHRDEMVTRLEQGDSLILFPEGTSSDGNRVLPFKSSFFSIAERPIDGEPLTVQPVSVAYAGLDGMPIGRALRPFYAWYGDMDIGRHIWNVAGLGWTSIEVTFYKPVTIAAFESRKALAQYCHAQIAEGHAASLTGRPIGIEIRRRRFRAGRAAEAAP